MSGKSILSAILPMILSLLLAAAVVITLSVGAELYGNTAARDRDGYENRTAAGYIMTKVRNAASPAFVSAEDFGGCPAIVIYGTGEEDGFLTRIYCHDGYLTELYTASALAMRPADGERLLPLREMAVEAADGYIRFTLIHENGQTSTHVIALGGVE